MSSDSTIILVNGPIDQPGPKGMRKKIISTVLVLLAFSLAFLAYLPLMKGSIAITESNLLLVCEFIEVPSEGVTALSYFVTPSIMVYIYGKRRDVPFKRLFIMFACFIICCGFTHVVGMLNTPIYTGAATKFITALVSFSTTVVLLRSIPEALSFPSKYQLENEIQARNDVERKLQELYDLESITSTIIDQIRLQYKANDILSIAASQVQNSFHVDCCSIHLLDNFSLECVVEYPIVYGNQIPHPIPNSIILNKSLSSGKAFNANIYESPNDPFLQYIYKWGTPYILCLRISTLNNCHGVLILHSFHPKSFTSQEILMLESIAAQISLSLGQSHFSEITEKAKNAKNEFLAVMSHELKTPLNAIMGMLTVLGDTCLTSEQLECYNIIHESSNALLQLLNSLLDFTKLDGEKLELRRFNLNRLVQQCVTATLHKIAQKKELKIEQYIDPVLPIFVEGDKFRIKQIILNLLSNAVKFTEKGQISFRTFLAFKKDNSHIVLRFEIQDTGIGISENQARHLFKPFSLVDSSMTRKYEGTGLGLAMCKKLCNLMEGDIWVESKLGIGSTFYVTVIVKIANDQTVKSLKVVDIATPVGECQGTCTILVVEDNEVNMKVVTQLLVRDSYRNIATAVDGQKAVEYIQRLKSKGEQVDIILMDLHMPVMDGLTATKLIRQEINSDLRPYIIALTADLQSGIKQTCMDSGMNDFVSKPFKPKELREVIERAKVALKIL